MVPTIIKVCLICIMFLVITFYGPNLLQWSLIKTMTLRIAYRFKVKNLISSFLDWMLLINTEMICYSFCITMTLSTFLMFLLAFMNESIIWSLLPLKWRHLLIFSMDDCLCTISTSFLNDFIYCRVLSLLKFRWKS